MKIRQRMDILGMMNSEAEVFVALFNANDIGDTFDIEDVTDNNGHTQIEIYEEEPGEAYPIVKILLANSWNLYKGLYRGECL